MTVKPKNIWENRKIAWLALAVCIVFSLFVMGPVKLNSLRNEALEVFRRGVHESGTLSVYTDLRSAAENANILSAVAAPVIGEDDEDILQLETLCEKLLSASDPTDMFEAYSTLPLLAEKVYQKLAQSSPPEEALNTARAASANIRSASNTIEKDEYFSLADEFNQRRSAFPASLFAALTGADPLPTGGEK